MTVVDLLFELADTDALWQKYCSAAIENYWKTKPGKKLITELIREGFEDSLTGEEQDLVRKALKGAS